MPNCAQAVEWNESVLVRIHSKRLNKRGDWMKQWLMLQNFTALHDVQEESWETNDLHITKRK